MKRPRQISSLACTSCRSKKVKCDRELHIPCTNCKKAHRECIAASDKRTKRPTADYIRALEDEVALLRGRADLDTAVDNSVDTESKRFGGSAVVTGKDHDKTDLTREAQAGEARITTDNSLRYPRPASFQNRYDAQPVSVYGPTSVFDSLPVEHKSTDQANELAHLNKDPVIIESVKQFFNWYYPDIHSFVPREAFLLDLFHPKKNVDSSFCSIELLYAVCALGASLSDTTRAEADGFYQKARASLLGDLSHPSIPLLQGFLLLGLYDIYNGRNNSGWMLTGIGLRMGFNLGFQLNPTTWRLRESVNELTASIRSRVFWGSFVVDHLLGLMLGRPALLQISDTTIQESEAIPDIDWIDEYNFPGYNKIIDVSSPLRQVVHLIVITEEVIHDIFYSERRPIECVPMLARHNARIQEWRDNLPKDQAWTYTSLQERSRDPTVMMLPYYYYIAQLCVNRPFIHTASESARICQSVTTDLQIAISSFTRVHGCQKCSILLIYAAITAISVILLSSQQLDQKWRPAFFTFMSTLKKSAKTWKLAQKSYEMVVAKLQRDHGLDYEKEYQQWSLAKSPVSSESDASPIQRQPDVDQALPMSRYDDFLYNSFGGPPLFMSSDFSTEWETLFPDYFN